MRKQARLTSFFPGRMSRSGAELKFLDTDLVANPIVANAGYLVPSLNIVPQNATESGRIGRSLTIKSIQCRIQATGSNDLNGELIRVTLVLDKQCNGAAPAIGDILAAVGGNVTSLNHPNLDNSSRFVILADLTHTLQSQAERVSTLAGSTTTVTSCVPAVSSFMFNKRVNIPVLYDAAFADGRLVTIRSNNLVLLFTSTSSTDAYGRGVCRIRYSDE